MTSSDSKIEKVQSHFKALSSVASSLNAASNELTKAVAILDEALKKLNVGLTAWVTFRSRGIESNEYDDDQIGYCKVNGKWGIALRRIWGDFNSEVEGEEGPWLFTDAPRGMRIHGVDKIPEVIEALGKRAFDTTKKIQDKTQSVRELARAVEKIATEPAATGFYEGLIAGELAVKHALSIRNVTVGDTITVKQAPSLRNAPVGGDKGRK